MKSYSFNVPLGFALAALIAGCTSDPLEQGTNTTATIEMRSELERKARPTAQGGNKNMPQPAGIGGIVDSLEVTSVALVASDLKVHGKGTGSEEQEGLIRRGQFLIVFDSAGTMLVGDNAVLAGTYSHVKFESHPLHGDIDSLILVDKYFSDFVTRGTSNTVIIHGYTYRKNVRIPFVFASGIVLNGQFFFSTPITLESGMHQELRMRFLSQAAFTASGAVLDPNDPLNRAEIENNLRSSVEVFRL